SARAPPSGGCRPASPATRRGWGGVDARSQRLPPDRELLLVVAPQPPRRVHLLPLAGGRQAVAATQLGQPGQLLGGRRLADRVRAQLGDAAAAEQLPLVHRV